MFDSLSKWDADESVKLIVLQNNENSASSRGDLKAFDKQSENFEKVTAQLLEKQYRLVHFISTMDTPVISMLDGLCVGGGLGLTLHTPIRIATQNTVLTVPKSRLGFFIDNAVSFFLNKIADGSAFGKYLAMTGKSMVGMDAVYSGLATHFVPADRVEPLIKRLENIEDSDLISLMELVDDFVGSAPSIEQWSTWQLGGSVMDAINRCFQHDSLPPIVKALEKEKKQNDVNIGTRSDLVEKVEPAVDLITSFNEVLDDKRLKSDVFELINSSHTDEQAQKLGILKELNFANERTFKDYIHRTVSSIVGVADVKLLVTGIKMFDENWGTFMDPEDLDFISVFPSSSEIGASKYISDKSSTDDGLRMREKRHGIWGVRQRVESILNRNCSEVGAVGSSAGVTDELKEVYLKWK
ncbi:hypothetical protein HK096_000809 [Nowakowskiella sp. JEL0078]|nr:hypothetical protein HK096_000809 [Nowakowskiella sp. JEL0078]